MQPKITKLQQVQLTSQFDTLENEMLTVLNMIEERAADNLAVFTATMNEATKTFASNMEFNKKITIELFGIYAEKQKESAVENMTETGDDDILWKQKRLDQHELNLDVDKPFAINILNIRIHGKSSKRQELLMSIVGDETVYRIRTPKNKTWDKISVEPGDILKVVWTKQSFITTAYQLQLIRRIDNAEDKPEATEAVPESNDMSVSEKDAQIQFSVKEPSRERSPRTLTAKPHLWNPDEHERILIWAKDGLTCTQMTERVRSRGLAIGNLAIASQFRVLGYVVIEDVPLVKCEGTSRKKRLTPELVEKYGLAML